MCRHHFASWCMYWIIAYFYILDMLYIKDKISVTLLHVDSNYANWIFQYIFYQYSMIWIQFTFYFFNFIIRWSILGSTFLSKSLYIYNDIKKIIQYFWIDIFKLIWNLILPLSMCKLMYKLCLHKIRPDKSDQTTGPELQNA